MTSGHPQRHHHQYHDEHEHEQPLPHRPHEQPFEHHRSSSAGQYSAPARQAASGPSTLLQSFADERRNGVALSRLDKEEGSIVSSHASSPYTSPHLAPRPRMAAAAGPMAEEVTLPPIQTAVPMRRGAVSGASSGPSLPFPPIRPPFEDDEMPSRGPSPTLGKRGSFSMGHSNHVPPGPEVQLPTPVLSGSGERRGTIISIPTFSHYHSEGPASDLPRPGGARQAEDSMGSYYPPTTGPQRLGGLPWTQQYKPSTSRSDSVEVGPTGLSGPSYHMSSGPYAPPSSSSSGGPPAYRPIQYNDDPQRHYSYARPSPMTHGPYSYGTDTRSISGNYRFDYQRDGSEMSPGSSSSMMHIDNSSLSPRMKQHHIMHHDDMHAQHDLDASLNGKRPRSAPRVMSSQPRIFACTQCPARFARNHDLKRHQRGHLSVRPYPCNWCGKSFSRKDALKRHILVKGCGKDGKGGGGGKGQGKGKRGQDPAGDKGTSKAEDNGDDDDDAQSDDDDDEQGDEQGSDDHQQDGRTPTTAAQEWKAKKGSISASSTGSTGRRASYKLSDSSFSTGSPHPKYSTAPTFKSTPNVPGLAAMHATRPSASVA